MNLKRIGIYFPKYFAVGMALGVGSLFWGNNLDIVGFEQKQKLKNGLENLIENVSIKNLAKEPTLVEYRSTDTKYNEVSNTHYEDKNF